MSSKQSFSERKDEKMNRWTVKLFCNHCHREESDCDCNIKRCVFCRKLFDINVGDMKRTTEHGKDGKTEWSCSFCHRIKGEHGDD